MQRSPQQQAGITTRTIRKWNCRIWRWKMLRHWHEARVLIKTDTNTLQNQDLVARNIYHSGNIGFKKVVDIFGEQIVGEDGEINRPLLADIIFKNPNKRIVLNSIIHPLVKQEIINQINNHKIAGDVDYCFVEAALLIEDHYDIFMDEIWYIYVSEDERRKRLAVSGRWSGCHPDPAPAL